MISSLWLPPPAVCPPSCLLSRPSSVREFHSIQKYFISAVRNISTVKEKKLFFAVTVCRQFCMKKLFSRDWVQAGKRSGWAEEILLARTSRHNYTVRDIMTGPRPPVTTLKGANTFLSPGGSSGLWLAPARADCDLIGWEKIAGWG